MSQSGLLFKLKWVRVGGSVLCICTEFLSNHRQRVVVDGAASKWIPIISGEQHGSVLGPSLFILYTSEVYIQLYFKLVENRLWTCRWTSNLLRIDYFRMQMAPQYWPLFASQQTDMQLLPPLTWTWLGFRSGAITGALYWSEVVAVGQNLWSISSQAGLQFLNILVTLSLSHKLSLHCLISYPYTVS